MTNKIVSKEEWLTARHELLVQEKEHTRERERIADIRRELPWVHVDKNYKFVGEEGPLEFTDVFKGRSQLVVYHLMFGADWDTPCIGCTQWADALNGTTGYFKKADARLIAVSRAPIEKLIAEGKSRDWNFAWLSSAQSDFNVDFYASSEDVEAVSKKVGSEEVFFDRGENHGVSVFIQDDDGEIYHTYSSFNRGIESMNGAFGYYDLLPKGRPW